MAAQPPLTVMQPSISSSIKQRDCNRGPSHGFAPILNQEFGLSGFLNRPHSIGLKRPAGTVPKLCEHTLMSCGLLIRYKV